MHKENIVPILDYYIDYEFQTRMMENSIKGKGFDNPLDIFGNGKKISHIITNKKTDAVWDKLGNLIKDKKSEPYKNEKDNKEKIRRLFVKEKINKNEAQEDADVYSDIDAYADTHVQIDAFINLFEFYNAGNKKELAEYIRSLMKSDKITVCYPIFENDKVKRPVITFNCMLEEDDFIVCEYYMNKECLLILLAYIEECSSKEIELDPEDRFLNLFKKVNSIENRSIQGIIKIIDDEIIKDYPNDKIKSIHEFRVYEGWRQLNRLFITAETLNELTPPAFKEEIQICKENFKNNGCLPPLLEKYILGNEESVSFNTVAKGFRFHYGSYSDKYPINEKQWDIVTAASRRELLAVDGPPGTGKTTLLKELIADNITLKAKALTDVWDGEWKQAAKGVLISPLGGQNPYSIVVTSTNNMAVDNIGIELLKEIPYFSRFLGDEENKGMLCAKLGRKDNVTAFYEGQFHSLIHGLNAIKEEALEEVLEETLDVTLDETVVDEFKVLWKEAEAIKKAVSEFVFRHEEVCELFGVEKAPVEIAETIETELTGSIEKAVGDLAFEEDREKTLSQAIDTINKQLSDFESEKDNLNKSISQYEENIKALYTVLEEYLAKSRLGVIKSLMKLASKNWRAFFHEYPSEAYIRHKIEGLSDRKNRCLDEVERIQREEIGLKKEQRGHQEEKEAVIINREALKNQLLVFKDKFDLISQYKVFCNEVENLLGIKDIASESLYRLVNCEKVFQLRKKLFDKGIEVTELYVIKNRKNILNNLDSILKRSNNTLKWCQPFFSSRHSYSESWREAILALWETFFICFPVITTTLHSFKKDMLQLLPGLVDLLMVDEAGQILPHYLCAPLYRSKRAVIVGDIHQLEPIRLLKTNLIAGSEVPEEIQSKVCIENNSAQNYSDNHSDIFELKDGIRTGIVLNEHRRCENNIMRFSNKHIYQDKLVIINPDDNDKLYGSNLVAFDVRGIKEKGYSNRLEIYACKKIVQQFKEKYGDEIVKQIAIISPFSNQVRELKKELPGIEIGSVHTFQGKEKDFVIFSTVIDASGGKNSMLSEFIGQKANLLNVSFSRAKKQFILMGNLEQIGMGSLFLKKALDTIREWGKVYSFFDSELNLSDLSEKEAENWKSALLVLAAEDESAVDANSELYKFMEINCPKRILIGPARHYALLKAVIPLAKKSICIFSPWISDYVVDESFMEIVTDAAARKVEINICFGYRGKKSDLADEKSIENAIIENKGFWTDKEQLAKAIYKMNALEGVKIVHAPPMHTKLLMVDGSYLVIGSHNWLQNSGKSNSNELSELSTVVTHSHSIVYVTERFFNVFS